MELEKQMDEMRRKGPARRGTPSQEDIDANSLLAGGKALPGPGMGRPKEGHVPTHGEHSVLDELGLLPAKGKR